MISEFNDDKKIDEYLFSVPMKTLADKIVISMITTNEIEPSDGEAEFHNIMNWLSEDINSEEAQENEE